MALILWVVALITIFVAWDGAASYATVPDQLPYFLSGGLLALVLTLIGCAVYVAGALARRDAANRSAPNEGPKQGEAR